MTSLENLLADAGLEVVQTKIGVGGSAVVHKCRAVALSRRADLPSKMEGPIPPSDL
jgi:hypothetical protein